MEHSIHEGSRFHVEDELEQYNCLFMRFKINQLDQSSVFVVKNSLGLGCLLLKMLAVPIEVDIGI